MNKFIKISLIVAAVLLGVGLLFSAIGLFGAKREIKRLIKEEVITQEKIQKVTDLLNGEGLSLDISDQDINIQIGDGAKELEINGEVLAEDNKKVSFDASTIQALELDLGVGSLTVEEKAEDDGSLDLAFEGLGKCKYFVEEGTLYVEAFKGLNVSNQTGIVTEVTIKVPKDFNLNEVDAKVGAGIMNLDDLQVAEMEAEVAAGELVVKRVAAGEIAVDIGAGKATVKDAVVKDLDVNVSMGECVFEGKVEGDLEAECAMGNIELVIDGKEDAYNYDVNCSAGNVTIGDYNYTALGASKEIDNGAEKNMQVKCSMGQIMIEFEE
ncbi:MAG: DUF4097 family beta strand repeat protein [Lachnospiraceae bacterium]|nr:DUF4097 family beta strand repeat protein [Lachnospiraceae bacterium]